MMRVSWKILVAVVVCFAVILWGWPGAATLQLKWNTLLWKIRKPVRYEYRIVRSCFCPDTDRPAIVSVERDSVISAVYEDTYEPVRFPQFYYTIDELFEHVDRALASADTFYVEYNREYGYPTAMFSDNRRAADDEMGFQVSGLKFE